MKTLYNYYKTWNRIYMSKVIGHMIIDRTMYNNIVRQCPLHVENHGMHNIAHQSEKRHDLL